MTKTVSLGSCLCSRRLPQYGAAIIANIVAVSYGGVQGWASPSVPLLRANDTAIGGNPVTMEEVSWLSSLSYLGALIASPFYSYVNQNWGRKAAGYLSAAPLIIGWLIMIFAKSALLLCIARFIQGTGLAGVNIFLTMYDGEIAEDSLRGALGNMRGLSSDFGIVIIYLIGPHLSIHNSSIASITIPLVFLVCFFWLPESPMFLLGKGKTEEARKAYLWLRGGDEKMADEEMVKLEAIVKEKSEMKNVTLKELISVRGTRKALVIGLVLATAQQFSGMNVVFGYCTSIFEMSGTTMSENLSSLIVSVVSLSGSLFACCCSDLAGRRLMLIITQFFQGLCLSGLAVYLYERGRGVDVSSLGVLPVIAVALYIFFVVAGPANLFYVVLSETFRPEARGLAMSITNTALWILAFLSTKLYPIMVLNLGAHGCLGIYAAVSFVGVAYVFFQLPETKNRSLESILRELNGDPPEEKT